MFKQLFAFELRGHFRRPTTWLYVAIMFLLAFFAIGTDAVLVGPSLGKVKRNSPYSIAQIFAILLAIGQIITSALVGATVLRDYEAGVHELLFTTRVTRRGYLAAKYLAAFLAMLLVFMAVPVGALLGSTMPWVDAETMQAINVWHYLQPTLVIGVPGIFFLSALLFSVGSITRSAFAVYVTGILLLVGYSVGQTLVATLDRDQLANLLDPFALQSIELTTRYWTTAEKNSLTIPLSGFMGANRALWGALGAVMLLAAFQLVRLEKEPRALGRRKRATAATNTASVPTRVTARTATGTRPAYAAPSLIAGWWTVTTFHARSLLRSTPFLAIAAIGLINVIMSLWFADENGQSKTWPMTWLMAETAVGAAGLFQVVLLTFYAGELVWRERQVRLDQVLDAAPVRTASVLLGKVSAMLVLMAAFAVVGVLGGMLVQLAKGFSITDPQLYAVYLFAVDFPGWFPMVTLAFLVQSLVPRKPIGHVIMILIYFSTIVLSSIGWDYSLLQLGAVPSFTWSDLNGAGIFPRAFLSVHGFGISLALIFGALAFVVWQRGTTRGHYAARLRNSTRVVLGAGVAGAVAFGGLYYYNTSILNSWRPRKANERRQVAFEQAWRPYETLAQPKVVAVSVGLDLEPSRLTARSHGTMTMVNRHARAIDTIWVNVPATDGGLHVTIDTLAFDRAAEWIAGDSAWGVHMLRLASPLQPGDSLRLRFAQSFAVLGFTDDAPESALVGNGSFFGRDKFPIIGYDRRGELTSDELRRKYGLSPARRAPARTDTAALNRLVFANDADYITFEATVSTDPDQIAMAPGYLEREWQANGRRYFKYVMDAPIMNFFSVLSARWTVTKGEWNNIPIEIYHHPAHTFNVARMIEASQASLEFFSREFGAYQHRQLRILEFPRYQAFAQSFPNTVPYSEAIGFVARLDTTDVEDTDLPYFVTAHEIAHQWFPYQRLPADAEGGQMLSESLSEYAALVIAERKHGRAFTQKFLRAELDTYLRGRAGETKAERPLERVDNQGYIQYQKGSLALFALRDLIGERALHAGLRAYLDEARFGGPPFATSADLMRHLHAATPDSLRYAVQDYFETITLWDVKADSSTVIEQPDGQFKVTLFATSRKLRADSLGEEAEVPMADYVDVGVFEPATAGARIGKAIAIRKERVKTGSGRYEFVVPTRPARVGIDPYNLLIDRNPGDNARDVVGK